MKRQIKVDNSTYQVEYEKADDMVRVAVDDRPSLVDASAVSGGFYSLLVNGSSHDVFVSRGKDHFSVVVAGRNIEVDFHDPRTRRPATQGKHAAEAGRQIICAPMAGRIVRFQVDKGDLVKDGDGLVVLEAMKMENELKSQGIGQIKEILVSENDVVAPGQHLMIIE
jgi:biotin carboxyl carrier protein